LIIHTRAHDAARLTGDLVEQAHALKNVGVAHSRLGRNELAAEYLHQALSLFRQVGDIAGQAGALKHAGNVENLLGHSGQAIDHYEQALTCYRQTRDRSGEGAVLGNLGVAEARRSRYEIAIDHFAQALEIGELHAGLDQPDRATEHYRQALAIFVETGDQIRTHLRAVPTAEAR
jgi:tetratricopeptide (TPR) repeat protein